jgi:hypothetical protein
VGRTPWSAADVHVGLRSGSWGTRADQGVRPTHTDYLPTHEQSYPAGKFLFWFFHIR